MDRTSTPRHLLSTLAADAPLAACASPAQLDAAAAPSADLDAQLAAPAKPVLDSADRAGLL